MNLRNKKIFIFLVVYTIIISTNLDAQTPLSVEYNFRNYTVDNGLPSSETYDVEQDNEGNIWIATDRGVVKYDGYKFRYYTRKDGLVDDVVLQLYKDPFGKIWFISIMNELCYYEKGKIKKYRYNNKIRQLFQGADQFEKKILVLKNNSLVLSLYTSGTTMIDDKGRIKKIKQENYTIHLFEFENKKIWSFYSSKFIGHPIITSIFSSVNQIKPICIAQERMFDRRIKHTESKEHSILLVNNKIFLTNEKKQILKSNKENIISLGIIDNHLWVGNLGKGVQAYKLYHGKAIFTKSILDNYSISNVLKDSKGGYWFTTLEKGVFYVPFLEVQGMNTKHGLMSNEIKSICKINKEVYIGYKGVGIQTISNNKIYDYDKNSYYSTVRNFEGKLLISNYNGTFLTQNKKIFISWLRDFYPLENKCLAVTRAIYEIDKNGIIKPILSTYSKHEKSFQAIMQDDKGIIWLGHRTGLYCFNNNVLEPYLSSQFQASINDLLYHKQWGKIIATRDDGLFILNNSKFSKIENLLSKNINTLFVDQSGILWMSTNKGVNILTRLKNGKIKVQCLTKFHGLYTNEVTSLWVDEKYAWIGTNKGLLKIDKSILKREKSKYQITLESISLKHKQLDLSQELKIPYNEDIVKINFKTINFITKGKYKYRLGNTQNWTYLKEPQITLLNPEEGEYQLEVAFLDENNTWSKIQNIAFFEITPPFWKTLYFRLLIALFLGYLISLFIRYKKRQFETKQKLLILEQKALFAQMNPHFIFNTLNSIQSFLIYNENDKAEYFLSKFSKLLRQTLHISRNSTVTLEKEIDLLEKYLELEQMRFSNKFSWEFKTHVFNNNLEIRIPNMLIQPYIENSIKHGFTEKREDYEIEIILTQVDDQTIKCEIIDNGIGRKVSIEKKESNKTLDEHVSYGEKITKERLKSYNKSKSTIFGSRVFDIYEEGVSKGTKVEVIIPIVNK